MPIAVGNTGISKIYVGSTEADKVYLGNLEVFPKGTISAALPSALSLPEGMTSHGGNLYIVNRANFSLWNINPANPSDESGSFGQVGVFSRDLQGIRGIASHAGSLYGADSNTLYLINPANPGDESGSFGQIGRLPSLADISAGGGVVSHGGNLYLAARGSSGGLWNINPANPGDTSGAFGRVGDLPARARNTEGLISYSGALYLVDGGSAGPGFRIKPGLWRINLSNPSDTSGQFGQVIEFPDTLDDPKGGAVHSDSVYVVGEDPDRLWRIGF